MNNGWYRLKHPQHLTKVQEVFQNRCDEGFVSNLLSKGWSFEEVTVLTPAELHEELKREVKQLQS